MNSHPWKTIWLRPAMTIKNLQFDKSSRYAIWASFMFLVVLDLTGTLLQIQAFLIPQHKTLFSLPTRLIPIYKEGISSTVMYLCFYFIVGSWLLKTTMRRFKENVRLEEMWLLTLWSVVAPLGVFTLLQGLLDSTSINYPRFDTIHRVSVFFMLTTAVWQAFIFIAAFKEVLKRHGGTALLYFLITLLIFWTRFGIKLVLLSDYTTIS